MSVCRLSSRAFGQLPAVVASWHRIGMQVMASIMAACLLTACVPALVGGAAVGTASVATDRRSAGTQLDDRAAELRIRNLIANNYSDAVQVTPSVYNGMALLVGTVPNEKTRAQVEQLVKQLDGVRSVSNHLVVGAPRSVADAAADSLITGQVRAALIGTQDLSSNAFNITTNRGVVYLQGLVTRAEGDRGAQVAASIRGVNKVVKLFEYISEDDPRRTPFSSDDESAGTGVDVSPSTSAGTVTAGSGSYVVQHSHSDGTPSSGALAIPVPLAP